MIFWLVFTKTKWFESWRFIPSIVVTEILLHPNCYPCWSPNCGIIASFPAIDTSVSWYCNICFSLILAFHFCAFPYLSMQVPSKEKFISEFISILLIFLFITQITYHFTNLSILSKMQCFQFCMLLSKEKSVATPIWFRIIKIPFLISFPLLWLFM